MIIQEAEARVLQDTAHRARDKLVQAEHTLEDEGRWLKHKAQDVGHKVKDEAHHLKEEAEEKVHDFGRTAERDYDR